MKKSMKKTAAVGFTMTTLAVLIAGCGGGGSGGFGPIGVTGPGGKVADGYVSGATVTIDTNDDKVCGAGDATTTTNTTGDFTYPAGVTATHLVCAKGGTDISTGQPFVGELKAPVGATQVTPLTTLVQAVIAATPAGTVPPTADQAAATVAASLGITLGAGVTLNNADPVALAATNPLLAQTTTAVQTMLVQIANTVAATATGTTPTAAQRDALMGSAISGLTSALTATGATPINMNSGVGLSALTNAAVSTTVTNVQTAAAANPAAMTAAGFTAADLTAVTTLQPASVAAISATSIANSAQAVASVPATQLTAPPTPGVVPVSLQQQTNTSIANSAAVISNSGMLNTVIPAAALTATLTTLTNLGAAQVAQAVNNPAQALSPAPAMTTAVAAVIADVVAAGGPAPVIVVPPPVVIPPPPPPANDLPIASASVTGSNLAAVTVTNGVVTVPGPIGSATMTFGTASGTPVAASAPVALSFSVTSLTDSRSLSCAITGLTASPPGAAPILVVPAGSSATCNGTHTNGLTSTATIPDHLILNNWVSADFSTAGIATINVGQVLADLQIFAPAVGTNTGFLTLSTLTGSFYVTVNIGGVALSSGGFPVTSQTVQVIVQ